MAGTSSKNRNLVHFLDEDEIENELTFFEEDGINSNEIATPRSTNSRNKFKRRKLFNTLDTNSLKQNNKNNNNISPISFSQNLSSSNKDSQRPFAVHTSFNSNKRKNDGVSSFYMNESQNDMSNNSYEIDSNEPFMPSHKSIKIDTNADAITSPVGSTSPIYTSTPKPTSATSQQSISSIPVRSSTPILPPSLLKSENSFSSISSISSLNKSKNDSNLSSIREDINFTTELSSSSLSNDQINNNDLIPTSTSTPISLVKYSSESSPQLDNNDNEGNLKEINDIKDIYSTEKLMNSKLIINLPSSVKNKNLYWNLGINSSESPFLPFTKEYNEINSIFSPYRSPILKNDETTIDSIEYSSSPTPQQKPKKVESTGSELVLFKPLTWKPSIQDIIKNATDNNNVKNNISTTNNLMITTSKNDDSFPNVNTFSNSSTPTSASITNKLPYLSLNKTPDKLNNDNTYIPSNPIPIPSSEQLINNESNAINNTNNSNMSTNQRMSPISPVSPIALSMMNLDSSILATSNSSSNSRKEIEIPYTQSNSRYYNGNISSSSFSTSPSPITSSALMNVISRNNTELQSNSKYSRNNNIDINLDKNSYSDLFDYKEDLLPSNSDHLDNDTIQSTNTNDQNINLNVQATDSMDVDF